MDFEWAKNYPDVYKVCSLFNLSELLHPKKVTYKPLPAFLQEGPQCGLVALEICRGNPTKETLDKLLNTAKFMNFTYNGEIFSANDMMELANAHLQNYKAETYSGDLNSEHIRGFLLDGGLILVPYDTGKDNSPSCENGHKAHWAIISGAIETEEEFFVMARHGKARNVAIWKLNALAKSNSQLNEFSPDRKHSNLSYKLPHGGINGEIGLKEKAVLLTLLE